MSSLPSRLKNAARRLMVPAFEILFRCARVVSPKHLSRITYAVIWCLFTVQKKTLSLNLAAALQDDYDPSMPARYLRGLNHTVTTIIASNPNPSQWIEENVSLDGSVEHLFRALEQDSGVIIVTPHFNNFPMLGAVVNASTGGRYVHLSRRSRLLEVQALKARLYRELGLEVLYRRELEHRELTARLLATLRENRILGMMPDWLTDEVHGVSVEIFNRTAYMVRGPALLSLRTGAPIVPAFTCRRGNGYLVVFEPKICADALDLRLPEQIQKLTQQWVSVFERYILSRPDEWLLWPDRNWTRFFTTEPRIFGTEAVRGELPAARR